MLKDEILKIVREELLKTMYPMQVNHLMKNINKNIKEKEDKNE